MSEPVVIEPVIQKDVWDCGVACLAMLLGVPWAEVRKQIRYKKPVGLSVHEMKRIAKSLGVGLSQRKDVLTEDIGILCIDRSVDEHTPDHTNREGHYVIFAKGVIYNPAQGQLWTDPEAYTKTGRWRVVGILKRRD